ncbi:hypothetical protein ACP70R_031335 [Stipagrostis hirtigluma subsp. patula]
MFSSINQPCLQRLIRSAPRRSLICFQHLTQAAMAVALAPRTAATTSTLHALLGALRARALRPRSYRLLRGACCPATSTVTAVLAALVCAGSVAAFPGAVAFFLPLVASTAACCAAARLAAASDEEEAGAAKEVVLVRGRGEGHAEAGLMQVYGDANASAYGLGVQVGCFLRRSAKCGVDEDGEEVVFAGRLLVPSAAGGDEGGALEEELAAMQVDRLAEGVWNGKSFSQLGGSSTPFIHRSFMRHDSCIYGRRGATS